MNFLENFCPGLIEEYCPPTPDSIAYHTQVTINGELEIPAHKPPSETILDVSRRIFIARLVTIPVKLDHGEIKGCKILVNGTVKLGVEYSAAVPEQNVHFVHFNIPFQGLIPGGPSHKPIPLEDCNLKKFNFHVCVELVQLEQVSSRNFEKIMVLLLWLKRKGTSAKQEAQENWEALCRQPDISRQAAVNHHLVIPPEKPPVECILDYSMETVISRIVVIDTPLAINSQQEKKVVITGKVKILVRYVADSPQQQVHAAAFFVPFEILVEWPGAPPTADRIKVEPEPEYFQLEKIDGRSIMKTLIIRFDLYKK